MANNPFFADATCIAAVNAVAVLCNGGTLKVYSGSQPTDANTAISGQTLLATLTLNATAFASAVASGTAPTRIASAAANAISNATAAATGTAAWFRCFASNGTTVIFDGSVGTSGCDLNLSAVAITSGETVSVTSFSITQNE